MTSGWGAGGRHRAACVRLRRWWAASSRSPPSPLTSHAALAFSLKPLHLHNTPDGEEKHGTREAAADDHRSPSSAENGLEGTHGQRMWTARTPEHKASGTRRSCCRLAFLQHRQPAIRGRAHGTRGGNCSWPPHPPDCTHKEEPNRTGGPPHRPHRCHQLGLDKGRDNEVSS